MSDVLAQICAHKRVAVAERRRTVPLEVLAERAGRVTPPRGFLAALRSRLTSAPVALITEFKRASPSKGLIRGDAVPETIARAYARAGASCLSVLTEETYFLGSDDDLIRARLAVGLPVLRKDFILEPYQVLEARAIGADCILLIMAALDDQEAAELSTVAQELGMDVLTEVHDEPEMERALSLPGALIGINNRNLKTLTVDLAVSERLAPQVPADRLVVGESGIAGPEDVHRLARAGVRVFLVGESLMRQADVTAATRSLLAPPGVRPQSSSVT